VNVFNDRHLPQTFAGRSWTLLLADSAYRERDSVTAEGGGKDVAFPHPLPDDPMDAASLVRATPFIDEVVVAFALHGVQALGLGTGPQTDVLAVSLSSTDYVGHRFGPDSREMHDQVLRDDRTIGVFLDSLFRLRDSSRVVVVLTSDHGVGSIPRSRRQRRRRQRDAWTSLRCCTRLAPGFVPQRWTRWRSISSRSSCSSTGQPFARGRSRPTRSSTGSPPRRGRCPACGVWTGSERCFADSLRDPVARRWSHQLLSTARVELVVTLDSMNSWGWNVASHGSRTATTRTCR